MIHSDIHNICKYFNIKNYTINEDDSIDVNGKVHIVDKRLEKFPLTFNRVSGDFAIRSNRLTSLKGSPNFVGGDFTCSSNLLMSLEGGTIKVLGSFFCHNNKLLTLKGIPNYIGNALECSNNNLYSLDYMPNYLTKLFSIRNNPFFNIFLSYIKGVENIELFNEFKIIEGKTLYLNRLYTYIELNNYKKPKLSILESDGYILK